MTDPKPAAPEGIASGWQPIETAPRKGTEVLVWSPSHGACAAWNKGRGWYSQPGVYVRRPTHWMPLPAPPGATTEPSERVTTFTPLFWISLNPDEQWAEYVRVRQLLAGVQVVPPGAEEPAPPSRPQDTYRWGETMTQYAVLGIGVEAWVELQDIEKRGIAQRNNDRSVMSINWRTFRLVMAVLRAIRLEDFEAARRLGAEDPVSPSPAGGETKK